MSLEFGFFLRRYKRFLADIRRENREEITVHCPNPGAMLSLLTPGNRVAFSLSPNLKRKIPYTWQMVEVQESQRKTWVGVNTQIPNEVVSRALQDKQVKELVSCSLVKREVPYGQNSRIDFLLQGKEGDLCYLEVKNVHFKRGEGALFPDCVTARGTKHMNELSQLSQKGVRCVVLYVVQREDCQFFDIAADIDPLYANAALNASREGVEMLAYHCILDPSVSPFIRLGKRLNIGSFLRN